VTEELGKCGYGGFILNEPTNHYTVWNKEGENQEEPYYDLKEEQPSGTNR